MIISFRVKLDNRVAILIFGIVLLSCVSKEKYPYEKADFRPELNIYIDKIVKAGELYYNSDTSVINYLRDSCSKEELLKLIEYKNPLVRVMAYRAIINRNEPDYFPILINHLDDTTKVTWWYFDDAANDFMVSDLMIRKVVKERKLSQVQKDSLVDKVLIQHPYLGTAGWMMKEIQPQERYYSIIKEQSQKAISGCHDLSDTYSLAKFRKQQDISLIKKNFKEFTDNQYCNHYYFRAIEAFPDSALFPLLTKYFNEVVKNKKQESSEDLKYYCRALAQYNNETSLEILTALTKKDTYPYSWYLNYNKKYVFRAIHKYPSPLYDYLYKSLKGQMDDYIIKSLDRPDYDDRTTW